MNLKFGQLVINKKTKAIGKVLRKSRIRMDAYDVDFGDNMVTVSNEGNLEILVKSVDRK